MKPSCKISKRPTFFFVLASALLIVIGWLVTLFVLNQIIESLWLNSVVTYSYACALVIIPCLLWFSEFRIAVESSGSRFKASRQMLVFGWPVLMRTFDQIDDVFWKKHDNVESAGPSYHLFCRKRSATEGGELSGHDVVLTGGFFFCVNLSRPEVDAFRKDFVNLRNVK